MELNDTELRIAEDRVRLIDLFSRLVNAKPGSHYEWDKARQLSQEAARFHQRLSDTAEDQDGETVVTGWAEPDELVSAVKVEAFVAAYSQHYEVGRRLWPDGKTTTRR